MIRRLRAAYYAGWRAGVARPRIQYRNGNADRRGLKIIATPECKLKAWLCRELWFCGWRNGMVHKLHKKVQQLTSKGRF